jgi:SAM-dependent methyltransferase
MAQYQSFPGAAGDSRTFDKLKALRFPDLAGKSFMDVGCNEGFFCGFAQFQGATRVVGIDHSDEFIARARSRFPGCEFHRQGWDTLPPGPFDVILLASALHYATDQRALIRSLVEQLSPTGTLVLELGIVSSRKAEWSRVKRGIDERLFPSMPMLREILVDLAWKWMGPSIAQAGDPVARHVIHISRRRPVAYLLMQPPGYGKSSIASGLFPQAGIPVVSGDQQIGLVAKKGRATAPEALVAAISEDYSPFHIDQTIQRIFDQGLAAELIALWLDEAGGGDVALDVYVPSAYHCVVERLLEERGYLPIQLRWERIGQAPLPDPVMAAQAEAFYMSMLDSSSAQGADGAQRVALGPVGCVDEVSVDDGQLIIRGWAIDANGALPERISVKLGRRVVQVDKLDKQLRPDVQRHLGLPHALVGYRACLDAPGVRTATDLGSGFKVFVPGGVAFQLAGKIGDIFQGQDGDSR